MDLFAEEPKYALEHHCPGTIESIYRDGEKYCVKIYEQNETNASECFMEISGADVMNIIGNWEKKLRTSIIGLRESPQDGWLRPKAGYQIRPNIEIYKNEPIIDVKI